MNTDSKIRTSTGKPVKAARFPLFAVVAVAAVLLLSACGLVVDSSPPSVTARVTAGEGAPELVVTGQDAESGVKRLEVHDVVGDTLVLRDSVTFPVKAVDEPVEPTRELRTPIAPGEDVNVVLVAVNGSGVEASVPYSVTVQPLVTLGELPAELELGSALNASIVVSPTGVDRLASVEARVNGVSVALEEVGSGVFALSWDTTGVQPGVHSIVVIAEFLDGHSIVLTESIEVTSGGSE